MTKLYRVTIPMQLAVEADNPAEARRALDALWVEVMNNLPAGAGVFEKEAIRAQHIRAGMVDV